MHELSHLKQLKKSPTEASDQKNDVLQSAHARCHACVTRSTCHCAMENTFDSKRCFDNELPESVVKDLSETLKRIVNALPESDSEKDICESLELVSLTLCNV